MGFGGEDVLLIVLYIVVLGATVLFSLGIIYIISTWVCFCFDPVEEVDDEKRKVQTERNGALQFELTEISFSQDHQQSTIQRANRIARTCSSKTI